MANNGVMSGGNKISNWDKPGGKLGMLVVALMCVGGIVLIYNLLPFIITLLQNLITTIMLIAALSLIIFLFTDKKIRMMVSVGYFMAMRSITGAFVEINPIAIVERRILEMEKKIQSVSKTMGDIKGLINRKNSKIEDRKKQMNLELRRVEAYKEEKNIAAAQVSNNQVVRLDEVIQSDLKRLTDMEKWYEILCKLEQMGKLTVQDTRNDIEIRKEEFQSIKEQHKAFKSVMSIMNGDPDELALFNQAMDFMAVDINNKIGEMEHVLDGTTGLIAGFDTDMSVNSKRVDEILARYNDKGLDGMFNTFTPTSHTTHSSTQTYTNPNPSGNRYIK